MASKDEEVVAEEDKAEDETVEDDKAEDETVEDDKAEDETFEDDKAEDEKVEDGSEEDKADGDDDDDDDDDDDGGSGGQESIPYNLDSNITRLLDVFVPAMHKPYIWENVVFNQIELYSILDVVSQFMSLINYLDD